MTPEKQKEFREFISKYMTQPMLGNKPGTRPDGFISEDDVINKIEAYKNEEVERALELGFEYGADWQEVGLPSKTQALESAFENYLNSNKD